MTNNSFITQDQLDQLIEISDFIDQRKGAQNSLLKELQKAILDSGKLTLEEWKLLRDGLKEIEELIPHIELIIRLKER